MSLFKLVSKYTPNGDQPDAIEKLVEGIKSLKLEQRPNKKDKKSFPSGHAVGAFSSAMYVHK